MVPPFEAQGFASRKTGPTREILRMSGEPYRIRTCDPLIKSQLLYQLS